MITVSGFSKVWFASQMYYRTACGLVALAAVGNLALPPHTLHWNVTGLLPWLCILVTEWEPSVGINEERVRVRKGGVGQCQVMV